ncbi:hypothetical protein BH18ACT15_BH18ACT15_12790 [soil metagenome]
MTAYGDAVGWIKASRPARGDRLAFARRAFGWTFGAGLVLLGAIAFLEPDQFGQPGSNTLRSGWPAWVLAALVLLAALPYLLRLGRLNHALDMLRESFRSPREGDGVHDGVAAALEDCPPSQQNRFALGWIWGPAALALAGTTFSFATAYFVIDALLSRFLVGWEQGALLGANLLLALVCFVLGARRLSTWRLALAGYRTATSALL